jgi:hypothetical protein
MARGSKEKRFYIRPIAPPQLATRTASLAAAVNAIRRRELGLMQTAAIFDTRASCAALRPAGLRQQGRPEKARAKNRHRKLSRHKKPSFETMRLHP